MIIIDRIKVINFKNILKAELKIEKFNLIVGPNNSGKSNFLKIFQFLDFMINSSVDEVKSCFNSSYITTLGRIKPDFSENKSETVVEIKFTDLVNAKTYTYLLKLNYNSAPNSPSSIFIDKESLIFKSLSKTGPPISVFSREGKKVNFGTNFSKTEIIEEVQEHISVIRLLNLIPEKNNPYPDALKLLNYIIKTPVFYFSNIELNNYNAKEKKDNNGRTISFNLIDEIINLEKTLKYSILKSMLKSILKIDEIKILPLHSPDDKGDQKFILIRQFGHYKVLSNLSDGSILLISLITKILNSEHNIFLIEEPENSLHPKALIELSNFIKSFIQEKQFIIATHSLTLLNTTDPRDVIVAKLNKKGQSSFSNVSNQKDILKKLKNGYMDFSDFIFFSNIPEKEFE